ncbi:translation initiation factor eIF-2B epsilon subunit, GEF [Vanrija albida]|uniref:Translation initiation factor eIF2B subunit epsilon n=1 Tax=Vanrija albida TaxID=181172 RepID=A0ABR3PSD6_9TREE
MPPKKQPGKPDAKSKGQNGDEAPLQAVVMADSFNRRFEVLCVDQPRMLLPLCSTPLLTWTLESLSLSGVKQVFIFANAHADQVREFVDKSPFNDVLDIQTISNKTSRTAGDALRHLDTMDILNADNPYILVHSPLIANYDFSKMVEEHKKRRETDKSIIMTLGVGRGGRPHPESPIMLVHPPSSRLLHYSLNPLAPRAHRVKLPAVPFIEPWPSSIDTYEIWSGTNASSSRGGYRDLGVDICEADVQALCTENFDYQDLRRNFLKSVLRNDLLGKTISVHLVGDEEVDPTAKDSKMQRGRYVERIRDTRTYGETAQDILQRWVFPLVPDMNEPGGAQYELRRGNVYVARDNVVLARTTTLQGPALIGARCQLSHNTRIRRSTLGSNCVVGDNTTLNNTHIWSNVRIGADCYLDESIIGDNVVIGDGVHIGKGTLIGSGCKIAPGVKIPEFSRIGREPYGARDEDSDEDSDDDSDDSESTASGSKAKAAAEAREKRGLAILGPDSVGFLWPAEEEEDDESSDDEAEDSDDEDLYEHPKNKRLGQLGRRLSEASVSTASLSTLSVASTTPPDSPASYASSTSEIEVSGLNISDGPPPAFFTEARSSLARAYDEGHSIENASLELKTLVMGYNSGIDTARAEVVNFLMSKVPTEGSAAQILAAATKIWARWGKLAASLSRELSDVALDVQIYCVKNAAAAPWFGIALRALYDSDIVDEDALIDWRDSEEARGEDAPAAERETYKQVFAKGKQYVDILEQMDSGSEEDESDDE